MGQPSGARGAGQGFESDFYWSAEADRQSKAAGIRVPRQTARIGGREVEFNVALPAGTSPESALGPQAADLAYLGRGVFVAAPSAARPGTAGGIDSALAKAMRSVGAPARASAADVDSAMDKAMRSMGAPARASAADVDSAMDKAMKALGAPARASAADVDSSMDAAMKALGAPSSASPAGVDALAEKIAKRRGASVGSETWPAPRGPQ